MRTEREHPSGNQRPAYSQEKVERRPLNLLTIDLEDWHQLTGWVMQRPSQPRPDALERQTTRLLELLARHQCRATFFCLGKSLEHCPQLVRTIANAGHEIASHGYHHKRIFETGLKAFREDLKKSLDWLGGLTGCQIQGYRAPCFSVSPPQLERFFDICLDAGLQYDSSVYPIQGKHYGILSAPRGPYLARVRGDQQLVEFPMLTTRLFGRRHPIAGGGSWRALPTTMIVHAIRDYNREELPAVIYFHPYEFDTQFLSVTDTVGPGWRSRYWSAHQNLGRRSIFRKLDRILSAFRFGAVEDYLRANLQTMSQ